jgi:hypothetical protein
VRFWDRIDISITRRMNMENRMEYRTKDFYLASCILASGERLIELEQGSGGFSVFVFDCLSERADQIIADHWSRKLVVSTRDLIDAINELKTRLHNKR